MRHPVYFSIAFVSAAALAYEVLLMRLYSIIQWHHFAYMIISLALLGYGGSGTFLALFRRSLLNRFESAYLLNLLLFPVTAIVCFQISRTMPFTPAAFLWDSREFLNLLLVFLLLALPFFFAANSIGLALMAAGARGASVYAMDLVGAGFGAILIIILLFIIFPHTALRVIATLGAVSVLIARIELKSKSCSWLLTTLILLAAVWLLPASSIKPVASMYKGLSHALQIRGATIVDERSSPLSVLTVVDNKMIPFRHAPGLSLRSKLTPPDQLALFSDGDGMTAINRFDGNFQQLEYLNQSTFALPYHLSSPKKVLIIGAGGGAGVLLAKRHGVANITAVELNPQIIELMTIDLAEYTGGFYSDDDVDIHIGDGRAFINDTHKAFDLIELTLLDSFAGASAGLYALNESYLYTVESFESFLKKLSSNGYLAVSRWVRIPPRDTLKLFATAHRALTKLGADRPQNHLLLIRGWQTSTLVVKKSPISADELVSLKTFCRDFNFDMAYYPGISESEVNKFNIVAAPYFYQGTQSIIGESTADRFFEDYKFDVRPATDDRPYFSHFFKWRTFKELYSLARRGGQGLLESPYLILCATLLAAILIGALLILLPLSFRREFKNLARRNFLARSSLYFACLGLGFLFLEIAFIQKFLLFLHHPLFSIAVVLSAFLIFAGLGSQFSTRYASYGDFHRILWLTIAAIVAISCFYLWIPAALFDASSAAPDILRILLAVGLVAPLAVSMGIPFPLALSKLMQIAPNFVPWAWGINGFASVIGAVLGTLIAISVGFNALVIIALFLYVLAGLSYRKADINKIVIANHTATI